MCVCVYIYIYTCTYVYISKNPGTCCHGHKNRLQLVISMGFYPLHGLLLVLISGISGHKCGYCKIWKDMWVDFVVPVP